MNNKSLNWIGIVIGVIGLGSLFFSLGVYSNNANNDSTTNNNGSNSGKYTEFVNNLKKSLESNKTNSVIVDSSCVDGTYTVSLQDNKLNLEYSNTNLHEKYGKYLVSSDVVSFFVVETGQGGCNTIYFINSDGSVSLIESEYFLLNNGGNDILSVNHNIKNLKDIVYVTGYVNVDGPGMAGALFVDINGNIYE